MADIRRSDQVNRVASSRDRVSALSLMPGSQALRRISTYNTAVLALQVKRESLCFLELNGEKFCAYHLVQGHHQAKSEALGTYWEVLYVP